MTDQNTNENTTLTPEGAIAKARELMQKARAAMEESVACAQESEQIAQRAIDLHGVANNLKAEAYSVIDRVLGLVDVEESDDSQDDADNGNAVSGELQGDTNE